MDRLQFYYYSKDAPPGKGVGEFLSHPEQYEPLSKIPHWRRMLSSRYSEIPFTYQGFQYSSLDHAMQAAKFRLNGYEKEAFLFSLESGSEISTKSANTFRKLVMLSKEEMVKWENQKREIKKEITLAKFSTPILKEALLGTQRTELWNKGPRIATLRCNTLEMVREMLQES